MKTYEPLTPPEYRRNERGQFDRPGKTLAKTAKKTGLNKITEENAKIGEGKPGPGRPKGSLNKTTLQLREMILLALDKLGGPDYLVALGRENSSAYASLLSKVLPTTLNTSETDGGAGLEIRFVREIVYPGGHKHIEGVTPKQLPAPASHVLPGSDRRVSNSDDSDDKSDA